MNGQDSISAMLIKKKVSVRLAIFRRLHSPYSCPVIKKTGGGAGGCGKSVSQTDSQLSNGDSGEDDV